MKLLWNFLFAGAMSFGIGDSLYVGYIFPKEAAHPFAANMAAPSILVILFIGLFVGNLRVPLSWLAWVVSAVLVAGILIGLHFLKCPICNPERVAIIQPRVGAAAPTLGKSRRRPTL